MAMWKNDDEMFALMKEKLYTPVVGDILDQMGYKHQFLPASIRPLAAQVPTAPYILPGETEDKRLKLAGYACTVLENDVYEYQAQKPFGYMTEALDDLKPNEIYIATGAHNSALWGELLTACGTCIRVRTLEKAVEAARINRIGEKVLMASTRISQSCSIRMLLYTNRLIINA